MKMTNCISAVTAAAIIVSALAGCSDVVTPESVQHTEEAQPEQESYNTEYEKLSYGYREGRVLGAH